MEFFIRIDLFQIKIKVQVTVREKKIIYLKLASIWQKKLFLEINKKKTPFYMTINQLFRTLKP